MPNTTYYDFDIPVVGEAGTGWATKEVNIHNNVEKGAEVVPAKAAGITGGAGDPAALTALFARLAAFPSTRFKISFPDGTYPYFSNVVWPVNVVGIEARGHTELLNAGTAGGRFMTAQASYFTIRGMTIDHQMHNQTGTNIAGWAALVLAKPAGLTGGAENVTGGMTLTATAATAATSISVSNPNSALVPGDVINLLEGANYERVRVARTYVIGSGTIPLNSPLTRTYTTAAKVTACLTGAKVDDSEIHGMCLGTATAEWHVKDTALRNAPDTAVGLFDGGGFRNVFESLDIENQGHWGFYLDAVSAALPPSLDTEIIDCHIRFLAGATDYGDATPGGIDGIALEKTRRTTIKGGTIDLTLGGIRGVRVQPATPYTVVDGLRVIGPSSGTTYGVADVNLSGTDGQSYTEVRNCRIENVTYGANFGVQTRGYAKGNTFVNCTNGLNLLGARTDALAQKLFAHNNVIENCGNGIVATSGTTAPAGSEAWLRGNSYPGTTTPYAVNNGFRPRGDPLVSASISIAGASFAPGDSFPTSVSVVGARAGDVVHITPDVGVGAGIVWKGYVTANDLVTVHRVNAGVVTVVVPTANWRVIVFPMP